jgi:putative ABC transport system ATP-binding protein
MIVLRDITYAYPHSTFNLNIPRLEVQSGEHLALTGASGCGKTTLLRIFAGILVPHSGQVRVFDREMTALGDATRRQLRICSIGQVFQTFELIESHRLIENILLPFMINGALTLDADARQRARLLAETAGLEKQLQQPVSRLSQGERQRVAICRALVTKPPLILADEPTGNLDSKTSQSAMQLLHDQARISGSTFVAVTHDHGCLHSFDRTVDFSDLTAVQAGRGDSS